MNRSRSAKRPFRILMIAPTSFFSDYGGHIRILEEARHLQAAGHEVVIITYYKGSDMPGLDIRRTMPVPWRTDYEVGSSRHKLAFDLLLAVKAVKEGIRFRPDIIHGHMHEGALIGGFLSKTLRVPLVFDFQGSLTAEMVDHKFLNPNGRLYPWAHRMEQYICSRLPDAILTSSIRAKHLLTAEFKVNQHQIVPLPDCADVERFDQAKFSEQEKLALRESLGIPPGRQVVAYLGLLTDYQGIPELLQAAAKVIASQENVHFLVMGYPDVARYQAMAANLGISDRLTFTGKVEYRHAPLMLSLGDMGVAPKNSKSEGSGKLLNYMALAQPVVAFDTAVHREYLVDLGVYAGAGDVDGFARGIIELVRDPKKANLLGQQLRRRAEDVYGWDSAIKTIINLYQKLTRIK